MSAFSNAITIIVWEDLCYYALPLSSSSGNNTGQDSSCMSKQTFVSVHNAQMCTEPPCSHMHVHIYNRVGAALHGRGNAKGHF